VEQRFSVFPSIMKSAWLDRLLAGGTASRCVGRNAWLVRRDGKNKKAREALPINSSSREAKARTEAFKPSKSERAVVAFDRRFEISG
jgi:hypothetical protein